MFTTSAVGENPTSSRRSPAKEFVTTCRLVATSTALVVMNEEHVATKGELLVMKSWNVAASFASVVTKFMLVATDQVLVVTNDLADEALQGAM